MKRQKKSIITGTDKHFVDRYLAQKEKILSMLKASEDEWDDWKWQFANRIDKLEQLCEIIKLSPQEKEQIRQVSAIYRWAITPYYLALTNPYNQAGKNPVRLMAIPSGLELDGEGHHDPMDEENTNPAGAITRRYPDRLIINVTNSCGMFCRHCQRRRRIGESDKHSSAQLIRESLDYVRRHKEIRDVLITGGDPLTLTNGSIDALLDRLRAIPHVEIIRLGSRAPVTMPQRITPAWWKFLKIPPPLSQYPVQPSAGDDPRSYRGCNRLADAGVVLGNQMVLLEGVNNDKYVVRLLNHELLKARVRPYYIFHAKQVSGTQHFRTSVDDGIEIMEYLRGHTSGLAIPTYIINAPGGRGKTPILPQYLLERTDEYVKLRTWEGNEFIYPNNPQIFDNEE
jgi:glutamate 2,3-aminomutase